MTKQKQHVSGDNPTVSGCKKPSLTSGGETDYFGLIPVELVIINILSRLPVKSKALCRCVSKLWSSIIRRPHCNELFLIKPPATPRLLFAFKDGSKLFFYSSPQPQNPDMDSSVVVTTRHHTNLGKVFYKLCRPIRGLVCSIHLGNNDSWAVISNPVTGEYVTTPKLMTKLMTTRGRLLPLTRIEYYFGYDPADKIFKVLRITWLIEGLEWCCNYYVLTLGTGNRNLLWRKIQCCTLLCSLEDNGICIDGVLFYPAVMLNNTKQYRMVCFNVRSEELSLIDVDQDLATLLNSASSTLINYKGKLGVSGCDINTGHFMLWVLEDAKKHKWSKHFYRMPHALLNERGYVRIVEMTGSGEMVSYPKYRRDPFFIFYFNLETNIIARVRLEVPVVDYERVYTFLNFVEDVELM